MEKSANYERVESVQRTARANNANLQRREYKSKTPAEYVQSKANANSANKKTRQLVSASKLMEAGAHIGLSPKRWNPKMKPYIHAKRSNNHVIDILKSLVFLGRAHSFLQEVTKTGGRVLIVGTKGRLVKELIQEEAKRTQSYYITQRWLGGTLTNFKNINKSIKKLNDNIQLKKSGEIEKYTKKEQVKITKDTEKLEKFYGGIKTMRKLPQALIVLDPVNDINAILEAKNLGIPVIALANTNADPTNIDFIVPVNNHSIRSIILALGILCDAIAEVHGEPTKIVGKKDDEIVLPEPPARKQRAGTYHKKFNNRYDNNYKPRYNNGSTKPRTDGNSKSSFQKKEI